MGEGEESENSRRELLAYVKESHSRGYKCCLYSGRDADVEKWMKDFDYIKLGSYQKDRGALSEKTTNQKMWMRTVQGNFEDITYLFWNLPLNDKSQLHNRNLHINGILNKGKVDIESAEVDSSDWKEDIENVFSEKDSNLTD